VNSGEILTKRFYVAIDVGKTMNCFAIYQGDDLQEIVPPTAVRNNRPGYQMFREALDAALQKQNCSQGIVGMEPTGIYHEAWAYTIQY